MLYTVINVGGGIGQDPETEVTHFGLNIPPGFFAVIILTEYRQSNFTCLFDDHIIVASDIFLQPHHHAQPAMFFDED